MSVDTVVLCLGCGSKKQQTNLSTRPLREPLNAAGSWPSPPRAGHQAGSDPLVHGAVVASTPLPQLAHRLNLPLHTGALRQVSR